MVRATINNATFDIACAAVPAPWGPLTRVSDLETTPTVAPNSFVPYEVESAAGKNFHIAYEDFDDIVKRNDIIRDAHGINAHLYDFSVLVDALDDIFSNAEYDVLTADPQDWKIVIRALAAMGTIARGLMPYEAYEEVGDSNTELVADFSIASTQQATTETATLTNQTTGLVSYYLLDWGDGSPLLQTDNDDDWVHAYERAGVGVGDDTYTITLIVIGPQGVKVSQDTILVEDQV